VSERNLTLCVCLWLSYLSFNLLLLISLVCLQPESDLTHARSVFERCVHNSSLRTPGGAASGWQRVAGEVQRENMFNSSVVKLCLRRSRLASVLFVFLLFLVRGYHTAVFISARISNPNVDKCPWHSRG